MSSYIHTDRAATFMSHELSSYLQRRGIACSHTSVYNAPGNGQCERYNGIIWSVVKLALKSCNLDIRQWESVLVSYLILFTQCDRYFAQRLIQPHMSVCLTVKVHQHLAPLFLRG